MNSLVAAQSHCETVTRARARHFYLGLRLTPRPRRDALFAVYAWMREADDIADDERAPAGDRRAALDAFAERTERVLDGREPEALGPVGVALRDACERYPIERDVFTMTIQGLRDDLERPLCEAAFADDAALDAYCERVGSTVGRACVAIWGLRAHADASRARALAVDRGIAFQRTNILRDVLEDFQSGRVYVPRSAFEAHGLTARELVDWSAPDRCDGLVRAEAARARAKYERSRALEAMIAPDCVRVLRTMSGLYEAILAKIEREPSRVARGRVRLSKAAKLAIVARSLIGSSAEAGVR